MKVTTVRFGADLWDLLERESALAGVSVSQYIREAALARAASAVAVRGEDPFERLAGDQRDAPREAPPLETPNILAAAARARAAQTYSQAEAVTAQSEQVRRRADALASRLARGR